MRRVFLPILVMAVVGLTTQTAWAGTSGAHFQSTPTDSINNDGALVVSWDEAGLGNGDVTYTLTADATATYACINNGGKHPRAANKETFEGQVATGGSFQAKNGRVMASLTTGPLLAPQFQCPTGQDRILAKVTYENILLTDTTNNVSSGVTTDPICRSFSSLFPC